MAAMASQLPEPDGRLSVRLMDYYRARAQGGVGLIIPAYAGVSDDAPLMFNMAIYDDSWINDWQQLIDVIHGYDVKVCIQLMHVGMLYLFAGFVPKNVTMKVPSDISWLTHPLPTEVVSKDDIEKYISDFTSAALRAKKAGADMVEIHSCHGSLAGMFMTPVLNRRKDEYGGTVENRTRFPVEVINSIKKSMGIDFPLSIRINGCDDIDGGTTQDEAVEQAKMLEAAGADVISVSRGIEFWVSTTIPSYLYENGAMMPLVDKIKKAVNVPVMAAGKITPELALDFVESGRTDFVALGRPLLADPELPNKLRDRKADEVRRCIYCMNCLNPDRSAGRGSCSVNPFLNRESLLPLSPANPVKNVMIIGGGLAGMQTASILADRGHLVSLYEKRAELGGQWNTASAIKEKNHFSSLITYLKHSMNNNKVQVYTSSSVTKESVQKINPDVVVVATGAIPVHPKIMGLDKPHVMQAVDVISGNKRPKGKCVVLGGRSTAMETTLLLADQGEEVSLVTRGELGIGVQRMTLRGLLKKLIEKGIPLYLHTPVLEIRESSILVRIGQEVASLPADSVISALGMYPENSLVTELEGLVAEIYSVGDCVKPRNAASVAYQASKLAAKI